jgi:nucleoside-diphosphate-sugar epimerase
MFFQYKFLVTGCGGQIGVALTQRMIEIYGENNVILSDISEKLGHIKSPYQIFEKLDVTDVSHYKYIMEKHKINYIVHLSGILSAAGEKNPNLAMKVNGEGVINALDMAKQYNSK